MTKKYRMPQSVLPIYTYTVARELDDQEEPKSLNTQNHPNTQILQVALNS